MAITTVLKMRMGTLSGVKTFTFKYAKSSVTAEQVRTLAQALITNGSIYVNPPQVLQSAIVEQTDTTQIEV